MPIWPNFEVNGLDWQCYLAGSSKRAPRIFIFSIVLGAENLYYVKSIETHARAFLPLNISAISSVYWMPSCMCFMQYKYQYATPLVFYIFFHKLLMLAWFWSVDNPLHSKYWATIDSAWVSNLVSLLRKFSNNSISVTFLCILGSFIKSLFFLFPPPTTANWTKTGLILT